MAEASWSPDPTDPRSAQLLHSQGRGSQTGKQVILTQMLKGGNLRCHHEHIRGAPARPHGDGTGRRKQ